MTNLEQTLAYIRKLPPAISGSGGHDAALRAACECVRFGLAEAETWQVMRKFNSRCQPEWSDKELAHKIESARKIARHGERTMSDYRNKPSVKPVTAAELRALSAARQSQKSEHGAQPAALWPVPDLVQDFLRSTGNTITAHNGAHGERLAVAPIVGRSVFDELTALPEPTTPEAKADLARSLAAAAIREGRHGEGWPMGSAADWRAWAEGWGAA